MAKVKDKAAIAARKRDCKAGNLEYTGNVASVKHIPTPNVPRTVATLNTKEENANATNNDVAIGIAAFTVLKDSERFKSTDLKEMKEVLRQAVIDGNFCNVLQVNNAIVAVYLSDLKEGTPKDAKAATHRLRLKAFYEAVGFITNQFTAGKMRWWIAKSHLNNHFNMNIPVTLPRANARVGVN